MTHLSDFSYLERCAIWIYLYGFFIVSVYKSDRFRCLKPRSILSGELKSIVTLMMIAILLLQFLWDLTSTYVKYQEGFIDYHGQILTKPFVMLQPENQKLLRTIDYVECVTFSLEVGVFFLLQSFWNYLANAFAKKNFMSSFEFKFYIGWAIVSMSMYPILQWNYRDDVQKREAIPQLAYGIEAMAASLLGIRTHIRFRRIISLTKKKQGARNKAINRLSYFKDMNIASSIFLFSYALSVIILCVDGLSGLVINTNKFAVDTLMANLNVCVIFLWLCLISIFHPQPHYFESDSTATEGSSLPYSSNPRVQNVNESRSRSITAYNVDEDGKEIGQAVSVDRKFSISGSGTLTNNGGFMRAMTPVTVDYPYQQKDTTPLTSAGTARPYSPAEFKASGNVAVEDPYNSQPVMFSMMNNSVTKQSQYTIPLESMPSIRSPISMSPHSPSGPLSPTYSPGGPLSPTTNPYSSRGAPYEANDSYHVDMGTGYQQTGMASQMSHEFRGSQQSEQVTKEWLWQSPDRRNT